MFCLAQAKEKGTGRNHNWRTNGPSDLSLAGGPPGSTPSGKVLQDGGPSWGPPPDSAGAMAALSGEGAERQQRERNPRGGNRRNPLRARINARLCLKRVMRRQRLKRHQRRRWGFCGLNEELQNADKALCKWTPFSLWPRF